MKNVSLLLIMFSLLLMSNLYSKAKLDQSSSPYASIEKYQSLIIDFQLIAEYLNPVDINDSRADIFITSFPKIKMILPACRYQQIFNKSKWHARISPTKDKSNAEQIPMKVPKDAVFAKSFSLNDVSLMFRITESENTACNFFKNELIMVNS